MYQGRRKHNPAFKAPDLEYRGAARRKTRRQLLLERMDSLIPWAQLEDRIRPLPSQAKQGPPSLHVGGDAAHTLRPAFL